MKIFVCPICDKPQECSDTVGDSCKVFHAECLDKALEPTRKIVKESFAKLVAIQSKTVFDFLKS